MKENFFKVRESDVLRAKSAILFYLLARKTTPKELERKQNVLLQCLKIDPEDKAFRALQQSLNNHGIPITNDTLLDEQLIDFDFTELVSDFDQAPNFSDVISYHIPDWAESSRIYQFLRDFSDLQKSDKPVTRSDTVALMNAHADKLSRIFTEEDEMTPEAVMARLALRESIAICGVTEIDLEIKGFSLGNLLAIGGYAGAGKTTLMSSMCYRNSIMKPDLEQAYYSLEVPRDELYMWFVARHSEHPKWRKTPGIEKLTRQRLTKIIDITDEEKQLIISIANDFFESGDYGKVHLLVTKDFPSMELAQFKSTLYDLCPNISVLYFDHINKLENISYGGITSPFQRMNTYIDFLAENMCKDFYGRMILSVVGVQINRDKHKEAMKNVTDGLPPYTNNCWAGVNAVERSAYYALAVFSNYELWREGEIIIQSLKHRIGMITEGSVYVPVYPEKLIVGDDAFGESVPETPDSDATYVDDILGDSPYLEVSEYVRPDES